MKNIVHDNRVLVKCGSYCIMGGEGDKLVICGGKGMRFKRGVAVLAAVMLFVLSGCANDVSNQEEAASYVEFFTQAQVHDIYVELDEKDWQAVLDSPEEKEYYTADVSIDGSEIENAGFRTRGNSSLRAAGWRHSDRLPFRIKFDEYVDGQTFLGLDEMVLNNGNDDPSFLREYLGYEAFRQLGMEVPYVAFFNLYVNGKPHGLYVGVEAVDNSYLDRTFGGHKGSLYKAGEGATLEADTDLDLMEQKKGSSQDKSDIQKLIRILDEMETGEKGEIESILDVDSVLRYFAGNAVLHNWDDYAGQFCHNYYLYMDNGRFHMLPWDMNEGFLQTGPFYRPSDGAKQDISTPITGRAVLEERPLVMKLLSVPEYYQEYLEYCGILTEWLKEVSAERLDSLKEEIQTFVEQDQTKFYSYQKFEQQFLADNRNGIAGFIRERIRYLEEALDGLTEESFPVS